VDTSWLRASTKETVHQLLNQLEGFYSETESIMQHVGEVPVFTVLRSRYLPSNFLSPLLAVLFNALCRSGAHGDPPRTVIFEEFAKVLGSSPALRRFLLNFTEELRHRPVSAVGGLQHMEDFPKGLWGAADNHLVFGLVNPQDLTKAKEELYGLRRLRFPQVDRSTLEPGWAWLYARRGSVPELARGLLINTRPTLIRAGGQTVNAGEAE
jgi:hypothetical protein